TRRSSRVDAGRAACVCMSARLWDRLPRRQWGAPRAKLARAKRVPGGLPPRAQRASEASGRGAAPRGARGAARPPGPNEGGRVRPPSLVSWRQGNVLRARAEQGTAHRLAEDVRRLARARAPLLQFELLLHVLDREASPPLDLLHVGVGFDLLRRARIVRL